MKHLAEWFRKVAEIPLQSEATAASPKTTQKTAPAEARPAPALPRVFTRRVRVK